MTSDLPPLPDWAEELLPKPKEDGSPRPGLPRADDAVEALIREASGDGSSLIGQSFSLTPVKSTNVAAVGYDGQGLVVKFTNGTIYRYPGAGVSHVGAMLAAPSAGQYFHHHIKSVFEGERVA